MKRALFAFVLMACASFVSADELTATTGCAKCNFKDATGASSCAIAAKVGDKVYGLKGKVDKSAKQGGEWVINGKISEDGKSIEVADMKKKA